VRGAFYIVGPTATGKSEFAARVAATCGGEIISADAFQIYAGLDLLTAKPVPEILAAVPHHLMGTMPLDQEMSAERFRVEALAAIANVRGRGKPAFIVGGSGMYVKALTHGLSPLPRGTSLLRDQLDQLTPGELLVRLGQLDRSTAGRIDSRNKRRLTRAVEICLLTGRPVSAQRVTWSRDRDFSGVFVFRDREELYERINSRVLTMFERGVVDEVRAAGAVGSTAAKTLGLRQIHDLLDGRVTEAECIGSIQQATRRYAKRQLTWFQRQSNFEPLNLSLHDLSAAIEWISRKARLSFTPQDD